MSDPRGDAEARHDLFRTYCLGGLSEEEKERVEEQVFGDDVLHGELDACGDELIRDYLAGALPPDDRARFERFFMASPRRRERVEFLSELGRAIDRVAPLPASATSAPVGRRTGEASPRLANTLAVAAALLLAAAVLVFLSRSPAEPRRAHDPGPAASPVPTAAPSASPRPSDPRQPVLLAARGAEPTPVVVARTTRAVRLRVPLAEIAAPSYAVVVKDASGAVRWRSDDVAPASAVALDVSVPAEALPAGDYELVAEGEALRGSSSTPARVVRVRFRVIPQP